MPKVKPSEAVITVTVPRDHYHTLTIESLNLPTAGIAFSPFDRWGKQPGRQVGIAEVQLGAGFTSKFLALDPKTVSRRVAKILQFEQNEIPS